MTNPPRTTRLVIFDIGGTVIRDSADVAAVFRRSLAEHGITPSDEEIRRWRGAAKRAAIEQLLGSGSRDRIEQTYDTFQRNVITAFRTAGIEPILGIERAFAALRNQGIGIVLTTGFDERVTRTILEALDWSNVIDDVVTADNVSVGRPAPDIILEAMRRVGVSDPRTVVNVGDTMNDLRSAAAAAVGANIGVLTGAHSREDLESVQHTAILDSGADVPDWITSRGPISLA